MVGRLEGCGCTGDGDMYGLPPVSKEATMAPPKQHKNKAMQISMTSISNTPASFTTTQNKHT